MYVARGHINVLSRYHLTGSTGAQHQFIQSSGCPGASWYQDVFACQKHANIQSLPSSCIHVLATHAGEDGGTGLEMTDLTPNQGLLHSEQLHANLFVRPTAAIVSSAGPPA